jgi:hypothetical protein
MSEAVPLIQFLRASSTALTSESKPYFAADSTGCLSAKDNANSLKMSVSTPATPSPVTGFKSPSSTSLPAAADDQTVSSNNIFLKIFADSVKSKSEQALSSTDAPPKIVSTVPESDSNYSPSLDTLKELKDIKKMLKKLHIDEIQQNMLRVEDEKIILALEDKIVQKIHTLVDSTFKSLTESLTATQQEYIIAEKARTEKILIFIGDQINTNMASLMQSCIQESMANFIGMKLPELINVAIQDKISPCVTSSLGSYFNKHPLSSSKSFQDLIKNSLSTSISAVMTDKVVPALTNSVDKYLSRAEYTFQSSMQTSASSLVDPIISDPDIINKQKISQCIQEKNYREAIVRSFYLIDAAEFINALTQIPSFFDLSLFSVGRLTTMIAKVSDNLFAEESSTETIQLMFNWLEELLIALDLRLESSVLQSQNLTAVSAELTNTVYGLRQYSTFLQTKGVPDRALRLTTRLLQSMI